MASLELTPEEKSNGWTADSLATYRRDRDKVADKTAGNVVTEFKRPKPAVQIIGVTKFNPLKW